MLQTPQPVATSGSTRPALDALDRRIVAALQLDGRATWRAIANALGEAERTITRRGTRLLETGTVRIVGKRARGNGVIIRAQCTPGMLRVSTQALAARPDSTFAYLLTGTSSCVAELFTPPSKMAQLVVDDIPGTPGVVSCNTSPVLHYYKTVHNWQPGLLSDDEVAQLQLPGIPVTPASNSEATLSPTDEKLLWALTQDGRMTYDELGRIARVSEATARRRTEALRRDAHTFIRAVVDPGDIGLPVEALLWLRVSPGQVNEIGELLAASPYVRYVSALLGEYQLLVDITAPTLGALQEFVTAGAWPSMVHSLDSSLVIQALKRSGVRYSS